MPYDYKSTGHTYSIEPSGRSNVCFKPTDNVDQRSKKIVKAIKNDLYYARLQQLITETVGDSSKAKKGSAGKNKWDDMESAIGRVMEETGLKQALANVTLDAVSALSSFRTPDQTAPKIHGAPYMITRCRRSG